MGQVCDGTGNVVVRRGIRKLLILRHQMMDKI